MSSWLKRNKWLYSSSRTRTISSKSSKGLSNDPGQNNCFLNSALQVLWHLDAFRESFTKLKGHYCSVENCVHCALESLFRRFHCSQDEVLPPKVLRDAMAETFHTQKRFQLGLMDDAAECFENLLQCIHSHIVENNSREEMCSAPHCISHQNFGLTLIQQGCCSCGETSEPLTFIELVHYVSAASICIECNNSCHQRQGSPDIRIGTLIRLAGNSDLRECPSSCGSQMYTRTTLIGCPKVISIGIVWESEQPKLSQIASLVDKLDTEIKLNDLFDNVPALKPGKSGNFYLSAIVCYYGKHYTTFLFHGKKSRWLSIDDASVTVVGKRWGDVRSKLLRGRHQPLLLLYSVRNPEPLSMETSPIGVSKKPDIEHRLLTSKISSDQLQKPKVPFMWTRTDPEPPAVVNNNDEEDPQPQASRFGQYVEPQAAQWTTYKPYSS